MTGIGSKGVARAERRRQLVDEAVEELGRRGYAVASMADGTGVPLGGGFVGGTEPTSKALTRASSAAVCAWLSFAIFVSLRRCLGTP